MLKTESNRNQYSILMVPETKGAIEKDFQEVSKKIQSIQKIPFSELFVLVPQQVTELFFEFLNKKNIKPMAFKKETTLNLFKF